MGSLQSAHEANNLRSIFRIFRAFRMLKTEPRTQIAEKR
jgi:hypothetical protein